MMLILLGLAAAVSEIRPVSAGLEIPNAIARQHDDYVTCQEAHFDIDRVNDMRTFTTEAENAITACKARKTALRHEADLILARTPDFVDPGKRTRALCEAFDGYDELRRAMALGAPTFRDKCK
jgi:hypothetical protein